jgi:hypothetical protein
MSDASASGGADDNNRNGAIGHGPAKPIKLLTFCGERAVQPVTDDGEHGVEGGAHAEANAVRLNIELPR